MASRERLLDAEFLVGPPEDWECPVCKLTLLDPFLLSCCGNHLCKSCVQKLANKLCPLCSTMFTGLLDKGRQRAVCQAKVRCPNNARGCEWQGELRDLLRHLHPPDGEGGGLRGPTPLCQLELVPCPNEGCDLRLPRQDLDQHQQNECPHRIVVCRYCNDVETTHQELSTVHWGECPDFPVPCPNNCDAGDMRRSQVESHCDRDCKLQPVRCPFFDLGCAAKQRPRKELQNHVNTAQLYHAQLLARNIVQIQSKQKPMVTKEEMEKTTVAMQEQLQQRDEIIQRLGAEAGERMAQFTEFVEDTNDRFEAMHCEFAAFKEQLEGKLAAKNEELKAKNEELKEKDEKLKAQKEKDEELKAKNEDLKEKDEELKAKNEELKEKDEKLKAKNEDLKEKDEDLKAKNEELKGKDERIESLEKKLAENCRKVEDIKTELGERLAGVEENHAARLEEMKGEMERLGEAMEEKEKQERERFEKLVGELEKSLTEQIERKQPKDDFEKLENSVAVVTRLVEKREDEFTAKIEAAIPKRNPLEEKDKLIAIIEQKLGEKLEDSNDAHRTAHEKQEKEIRESKADIEKKLVSLAEGTEKLKTKVDEIVGEQAMVMEEEMERIRQELNERVEEVMAEVEYVEKAATPTPPFSFTVSRFTKRREKKDSFVSEPFYTSRRGYKMVVRVDAAGTDTHVSVWCCITRGQHDDIILWPLQADIFIRLINQRDKDKYYERQISYDHIARDKHAGRVLTGDKNYLWGLREFITLREIQSGQYLVGDALDFVVDRVELKEIVRPVGGNN